MQITGQGGISSTGSDGITAVGADGFAFLIQNNPAGANTLGPMGGGLGYDGIANCLAIEFDTFCNAEYNDPNNNHCAVQAALNGGVVSCTHSPTNTLAMNADLPARFNDQKMHTITINYVNSVLQVTMDNIQIINLPIVLGNYVTGNSAYIGYTATTGGAWENNDFYSWDYIPVAIPANIEYRHNNKQFALASFCDGHVAVVKPK